jgi:hypothetical protein
LNDAAGTRDMRGKGGGATHPRIPGR